ncbi:MAG: CDP-archaeol synthase [Verrucomicrobiaceae bacterium]|nr:MAG: CDP-archaeol synthase [Verrucomicrobiaceae bacterium]
MADNPTPPAPSKALVFARRSASTVSLWALVCAVFVSHVSWAFLGLIGLLTVIATIEYFRMLRAANVRCFPRFGLLLAVAYCAALYGFLLAGKTPPPGLEALVFFIALAGAFTLQLREPVRGIEALLAVAATVLGFGYIAFLFNFTAHLIFAVPGGLDVPGRVSGPGAFLLLWLLAVTKFTDMGAYITGSLIGRHKMIPHVSPGKTWEGFGGALFFAQLAGCGLYAAFPGELAFFGGWKHVVILGFLLAILAVIGDLAESIVKRALDAKDSGRMLPGIGGSLDLIDSVCFTAPALYFYLKWFLLPAA